MEILQLSEPQLAEAKRQAKEEEESARDKANAVDEEVKRVHKEAEEEIERVAAEAKEIVEKAEASVKRAQDKLKSAKEKSDSMVKDAELKSWGKKKVVEAEQSKAHMGVIEAATKTNDLDRAYLEAQRRYQELRDLELNARPPAVDKVVIETIPNPYM